MRRRKSSDKKDACPVCRQDLYYDEEISQRIGIIGNDGDINEWKCPFCESEFDLDNNILYIYGSDSKSGIA
jgi:uncharacterized protein YbaR (Trm112 family)